MVEFVTDGVLLLMKSPMRERDWSRFDSELTAEELPVCPPDAGPACCSLLEMRERRSELRVWESGRAVLRESAEVESLGVLLPIRPPILDLASLGFVRVAGFELAAPAWSLPAMPDCAAVGADGRLRSLDLRVSISDFRFSIGDREFGVCVLIGLPIREVRSELIVLRPVFCVLRESDPGELG